MVGTGCDTARDSGAGLASESRFCFAEPRKSIFTASSALADLGDGRLDPVGASPASGEGKFKSLSFCTSDFSSVAAAGAGAEEP